MKKTSKGLLFLAAIMAMISCASNTEQQPAEATGGTPAKAALAAPPSPKTSPCTLVDNEDRLDFGRLRPNDSNAYKYTNVELQKGELNFTNIYKYENGTAIENLEPSNERLKLKDIKAMLDTIVHSGLYEHDTDFSALAMHFGMEGKRMILVYEPIILKKPNAESACAIVHTETYFRDNGTFSKISTDSFNTLIVAYQSENSNIHIIHPDQPKQFKFRKGETKYDDIQYCYFTIQQLINMYCDNSATPNPEDLIEFSIVAHQMDKQLYNYQLHVVAHHQIGVATMQQGTYKGLGADFAQMCPVNCNYAKINYYRSAASIAKLPFRPDFKQSNK